MTGGAVEQPRYTLTDDGAFLRLSWAAGVTMGEDDVRSTIAAVTAASPGGRRPLLVNIGLVEAITATARSILIEDTCSSRTAVVGVDEMGKVLTAFNYRAVTPSRYFTDEATALEWLMQAPDPTDQDHGTAAADAFDVWLDNELVVVEWGVGAQVTVPVAEAVVRAVEELSGGTRFPLLSLSRSPVPFTEDAIEIIMRWLDVTALALVGIEEDGAIAAYYRQLRKPLYAVGYFGTVAEARRWLARASPA
ncbi:hypothetical protein AC792_12445 [Arthrobacter sp. RIT-PI-e]|uniref:DUF7793 family protein n=1 Tax=Arthrobacter sp. RIT-PI-e TaxID=1681197 RepID=UPI000675DD14|nr:hypothetical protein [Arthrobacter sp. RIT-PI-e]KNC18431.1 hypothetical protein AC792_12445 [Arthrobacter sp. RIT-PI-e]